MVPLRDRAEVVNKGLSLVRFRSLGSCKPRELARNLGELYEFLTKNPAEKDLVAEQVECELAVPFDRFTLSVRRCSTVRSTLRTEGFEEDGTGR